MFGWHGSPTEVLLGTQRLFISLVVVGTLTVEGVLEWQERRAMRTVPAPEVDTDRVSRPWVQSLIPVGYVLLFAVTLIAKPSIEPRFIYFQF
jgi:hypothetical protein